MRKITAKIYVSQQDNDVFFGQKLPTWRNGFCLINRTVNLTPDPDDVYREDEYGLIKVGTRQVFVCGDAASGMEILGWKAGTN